MIKLLLKQEIEQWRDCLLDNEFKNTEGFHIIHYPKRSGVYRDFCNWEIKNCWEITNNQDIEISEKMRILSDEFLELYKQNPNIHNVLFLFNNKDILGRLVSYEEEYEYRKERNFEENHPYTEKLVEVSEQIQTNVIEFCGYKHNAGYVDICNNNTAILVMEYENYDEKIHKFLDIE